MKGTINIIYSKIADAKIIYLKISVLLVAMLLQSCGGSSSSNTVYNISADVNSVSFSNEFLHESTEFISIDITFDGEGLLAGYASETEETAWLFFQMDNITATSATLNLSVVNAERLIAGQRNTTVRLTTTNENGSVFAFHDIDVSLLIWDIAVNTEQVNFSATFGDANVAAQTIEITSDNEWTATTDESWLSLDVTSGTGNATITVNATPDHSSTPEVTNANIIFTEVSTGKSKTIPVQLALDNRYFYADSPTIAFTKTANINVITMG